MKNTFGTALSVTLFGESHGEYIGAVLDGLAPGIKIDLPYIEKQMARRRPQDGLSTARREPDPIVFASGVVNGTTCGTPLTVLIRNQDTKSGDYSLIEQIARPSHADYTANEKYHGYQDARGGGHFSGRITAAIVAAGAVVQYALEQKGIYILSHIESIAHVKDRNIQNFTEDRCILQAKTFPALDDLAEDRMKAEIQDAKANGDSVGGIIETVMCGIPAGVGEPWFDTAESLLSHMLFSVPAVKGVSFGDGFGLASMRGSAANDVFYMADKQVKTKTNRSGGINGGITNGMPVVVHTAVKPTATIMQPQNTVNFVTGQDTVLSPRGRHDPCIVHRAVPVVDAVCALALGDMLTMRFGTDYLGGATCVTD